MTAAARASAQGLAVGATVGPFTLTAPAWRHGIADCYRATGPSGAALLYVIRPDIAANPAVREAIGRRAAHLAAIAEHRQLVHTLGAGDVPGALFVATADAEGNTLRDVLQRKQQAAPGGVGPRGAANLVSAAAAALVAAGLPHGALTADSLIVGRTGSVKLADVALGHATAIAVTAKLAQPNGALAPEILAGGAPSPEADVFALGALLYQALVGRALERGGPRPSEVVPGLTAQVDELVARACHRDPSRRFGSVALFREIIVEALTAGGAVEDGANTSGVISAVVAMPTSSPGAPTGPQVAPIAPPVTSGAGAGSARVAAAERALAGAMADPTENWLVARGKFDYGPYSLAAIVDQIKRGEVVAGNIIIDKDTGARVDAGVHPLLAPLVDAARQQRDDARRAQAEVAHQGREKRRGAALFAVIGLGVAAVAVVAWFIVKSTRSADSTKVAGISGVEGASIDVAISAPKVPEKKARTGGGRSGGGGGGQAAGGGDYDDDDETLSLDMSNPGLGSEQLSTTAIYNVYSKKGGALVSCVSKNGGGAAHIAFTIDGPTGKVTTVKVNGQKAGGLQGCIAGVLRGLSFPTVDGPRTRAEFDIGG